MAAKWICDGCGKERPGEPAGGRFLKPSGWYERSDADGIQTACSRRCIDRIAAETGKTGTVLPI